MKTLKWLMCFMLAVSMVAKPAGATEVVKGYTVEDNTDYPTSDAAHQVTFTVDGDALGVEKEIEKISLTGNFHFYSFDQLEAYDSGEKIPYTSPYNYKDGMFTTGYSVSADSLDLVMEENDGVYSITLPLPGGEYYYGYNVVYTDGTSETIHYDPTNIPVRNSNGHDSGWSLAFVGDASTAIKGQEYIFPRNDKNGTVSFVEYTAVDGTKQPLSVYLPYGYDSSKTYKTLYVSHGGGGNEVEWMYIGAGQNIMDNLQAEGLMKETIMVTMDHTYFGWNMDTICKNLEENLIPYIEEHYSVSKSPVDRAFCGLSMGGLTTTAVYRNLAGEFGYLGIWSATNLDKVEEIENKDFPTIMLGYGIYDFGKGGYPKAKASLEANGIPYTDYGVGGAHDWQVWRELLTIFAKDIIWKDEPTLGAVVSENDEFKDVDVNNKVTFTLDANMIENHEDITKIALTGNFQFYSYDQKAIDAYNSGESVQWVDPYHYEDGMFTTGYPLAQPGPDLPLENIGKNIYQISLPLPGNLYYYDYVITYSDGSTVTIKDPVNMPYANPFNGHDSGHSLVYVGSADDCIKGQELIYPRTDGKVGTLDFVTYTAIDGTEQPLGVYLPYGYDSSKTYNVLYVSHGGGGNEVEWFHIGSGKNIMDNLHATGDLKDTIMVTMDNTYFGWDFEKIVPNQMECIIPYIEEHYSVSKEASGRAFCGLSMGGITTTMMYKEHAKDFGYLGIWSATYGDTDVESIEGNKLPTILLGYGCYDFGNKGFMGYDDVIGLEKAMDNAGVEYDLYVPGGAHDWQVWRDLLTVFGRDYIFETAEIPEAPVTPEVPTVGIHTSSILGATALVALLGTVVLLKKKEH